MDVENQALQATKDWIENWVIKHNLCPFAKVPFAQNQIRYLVVATDSVAELEEIIRNELAVLDGALPENIETTVLILTQLGGEFYDYLDLIALGEEVLIASKLEGIFQLASFHPQYQFAGTQPDDVENRTNRSPFPLLHIIREDSISAAADLPMMDLDEIPNRNIAKMKSLFGQ